MLTADGVVRHLAAVQGVTRIAVHVVDVPLERVTTPEECAHLAVAGNDPVSVAERRRRADDGSLFSEGADVKGDAALALNPLEAIVDDAGSDHRFVERDDLVDRQAGVEVRVEASIVSYDVHVPAQLSTVSFFFP